MKKLKISGISTIISDQKTPSFHNNELLEITPSIAEKAIKKSKNVPVYLDHKSSNKIGQVNKFYKKKCLIGNQTRKVLAVDFTIDSQNFISALQNIGSHYLNRDNKSFISTDNFVECVLINQYCQPI